MRTKFLRCAQRIFLMYAYNFLLWLRDKLCCRYAGKTMDSELPPTIGEGTKKWAGKLIYLLRLTRHQSTKY